MSEVPRTAFVLGAGLGTRLRPLTDRLPKPLLPLGGEPLVKRALTHLAKAGVTRLLINTHHLPEAWPQAFPQGAVPGAQLEFIHEPELLDTGGGLSAIAHYLTPEDRELLLWNGDCLGEPDLAALVKAHRTSQAEATLLLRPTGPLANVRLSPDGRITDCRDQLGSQDPAYQFTGIAVVTAAFAKATPPTKTSWIDYLLQRIRENPEAIRGWVEAEGHWDDIGTPEAYAAAHLQAAQAQAAAAGWIPSQEAALAKGGSGRRFLRARHTDGRTGILCLRDGVRQENAGYGALAQVLRAELSLNVPAVYHPDTAGALVLEDLGTVDLQQRTTEKDFPWDVYASALQQVNQLHRGGLEAARRAGLTLQPAFDAQLYRWECDYFLEHNLNGRRLDRGIHEEMSSLARELLAQPRVAVHRDFQSHNIMVRDNAAWLLDFQGMREGCAAYDFASLAFDPYVTRPDMQLWRIEIEDEARELSDWKGSRDAWTHLLHVAATQRLLQACGAYANLGQRQGRADFLAHLPAGLSLLENAARVCGRRRIADLVRDLREQRLSGPARRPAVRR